MKLSKFQAYLTSKPPIYAVGFDDACGDAKARTIHQLYCQLYLHSLLDVSNAPTKHVINTARIARMGSTYCCHA